MLALIGPFGGVPGAAAQMVSAGDSVRVRMNGAVSIEGITAAVQGERILLRTAGVDDLWPMSMFEMAALHVLRPRTKSEGFRLGFGTGLVAGLFIGAAVGLALHSAGAVGSEDDPPAELLMQTTLTATGIGSLAGGFIGGFRGGANPGRGWKRVPLPNLERRRR